MKYSIVIPVYTVDLTPVDNAGLTRLAKVVGDKNYPTIFVCPKGLDLSNSTYVFESAPTIGRRNALILC